MVRPREQEVIATEKIVYHSQFPRGRGHAIPRRATPNTTKHLACMDTRDPSFGQNESPAVLPITTPEPDNPLTSQDIPGPLTQTPTLSAEQFHLVDQNGQPVQYELQSLGDSQMMIVASPSENGQVLHVIPSTQTGMGQVIIPQGQLVDANSPQDISEEKSSDRNVLRVDAVADSTSNYILHPRTSLTLPRKSVTRMLDEPLLAPLQPLSSNTPIWACRLRSCEKIGDSYRGYCVSETELESVLTFHKQQTQSVWGTRQSPSPAKPATRLMWKSQYVPYDGIPFVNAGSRAVVMECQYGPRRKGFQLKKISEQESRSCQLYKATCPARIYIKKVQKFPEYRVPTDPKIDKKIIRMEQEKAFNMLKKNLVDAGGVLRWYVQLPTQQAHQYHELETTCLPLSPSLFPISSLEEEETTVRDENCTLPSRLHPQVAHKIQELVSQGIEQVYAVRKQLRKFVERELFKPDEIPERHNLSYFPTVNDIKNHIHEVQKSLQNGDTVYNSEIIPATLQWTTDSGNILRETVTVTFAEGNSPGESIPTKVETNQTGTSLSPEPTHLLSSLSSFQPKIFTQLQGLQLQSRFTSPDGSPLLSVNNHPSSSPSRLLDSIESTSMDNNSLLRGQSPSLPTDTCLTQNNSTVSTGGNFQGPDQTLVAVDQLMEVGDVEDTGNLEGSVHEILLGDVQTVPIQIIDNHPALIEENTECTISVNQVKQEPKEPTLSMVPKMNLDCEKLSAT
ncbi:calcium-responsive transcription factor isoform X1 [Heterocephalus glaber]|uniref:Calcium-responsive transcription factor isoform X1 n=3 Tax=Heterocephalus glaber TaxID=10181 RepID=A0AAX6TE21_HETGA|nr:calcium-responsive transcription factor isoform X1 [Heterocephalus glaber]XP_021119250.1 calcium-responsive transcription factor isoform X1 [Heterocephalus glaber]XP_021119251.1 calcium-responsive transcription factor isoform X1 [Heterocephalus glaber]XP_021119252.1 calcium-responsive transcription factor isoform X1 [Heterocephalus glaber]XP_021119253.1 calcium-responsive transcription factor isoform X1 [Heterocephalus glaber]XP_021119254.1 calcium-responsive transcription factor isoform X1